MLLPGRCRALFKYIEAIYLLLKIEFRDTVNKYLNINNLMKTYCVISHLSMCIIVPQVFWIFLASIVSIHKMPSIRKITDGKYFKHFNLSSHMCSAVKCN